MIWTWVWMHYQVVASNLNLHKCNLEVLLRLNQPRQFLEVCQLLSLSNNNNKASPSFNLLNNSLLDLWLLSNSLNLSLKYNRHLSRCQNLITPSLRKMELVSYRCWADSKLFKLQLMAVTWLLIRLSQGFILNLDSTHWHSTRYINLWTTQMRTCLTYQHYKTVNELCDLIYLINLISMNQNLTKPSFFIYFCFCSNFSYLTSCLTSLSRSCRIT